MKQLSFITLLMALVLLILQCKALKKKQKQTLKVTIKYTENYCGGAAPPEELINELNKPKLLTNSKIEVKSNKNKKPIIYTTDEYGNIELPISEDKYQISYMLYQDILSKLKNFNESKSKAELNTCYHQYYLNSFMEFNLKESKDNTLILHKTCDPCIEPAP